MIAAMLSNWKFLMLFYIVAFGLWGFLLKIASAYLNWKTLMMYVWFTTFFILGSTYFKSVNYGLSKFHWMAITAGIIASAGTIAFYKAMSMAPASLVIPVSAQYILVTAVLCVLFLKEPLSMRLVAGIACSIAAIILLSK